MAKTTLITGANRGIGLELARMAAERGDKVFAAARPDPADKPDSLLDPNAIARTYWHFLQQDRSSWSWEVELRPWVERF